MLPRASILVLITCFYLIAQEESEEKYDFAVSYQKDVEFKIKIDTELETEIKIAEKDGQRTEAYCLKQEANFSEVLIEDTKSTEGEIIQKYKIKCLSVKGKEEEVPVETHRRPPLIEGEIFFLERKGDKYKVTPEADYLDPKSYSYIGMWHLFNKLLPQKGVQVGDEWVLETDDMLTLLLHNKELRIKQKIKCHLKEVQDEKATIKFESTEEQMNHSIKFSGEVVYCFHEKRIIEVNINAQFKINISPAEDVTIQVESKKASQKISFQKITSSSN